MFNLFSHGDSHAGPIGRSIRPIILGFILFAFGGNFSTTLFAQTYPSNTVRIIVPFAPGGTADVTARKLAELLTGDWKQAVVIENKVGGGNTIGMQAAIHATPDGYTILFGADPAITTDQLLRKDLPYDPERDLMPVTTLATFPSIIVVNSDVPVTTLTELVALSKTKPLFYGSFGIGTTPNLVIELFKNLSGAELVHIPYKGVAPLMMALTSNEVQVGVMSVGGASAQIKAGRLRGLAVEGKVRAQLAPDIPTFTEAGFPKLRGPSWFGMFVPKGTPTTIIAKLNHDIAAKLKSPEMTSHFDRLGYTAVGDSPENLAQRIQDTKNLWAPIIKSTGLKIE